MSKWSSPADAYFTQSYVDLSAPFRSVLVESLSRAFFFFWPVRVIINKARPAQSWAFLYISIFVQCKGKSRWHSEWRDYFYHSSYNNKSFFFLSQRIVYCRNDMKKLIVFLFSIRTTVWCLFWYYTSHLASVIKPPFFFSLFQSHWQNLIYVEDGDGSFFSVTANMLHQMIWLMYCTIIIKTKSSQFLPWTNDFPVGVQSDALGRYVLLCLFR